MALERVGLGGMMTFNAARAVRGMNQASTAAGRLQASTTRLSAATARSGGVYRDASGKFRDASGRFAKMPQTMNRASMSFQKFGSTAGGVVSSVGRGVQRLGGAITKLGMAATALGVVFGLGVKKAADFEQQMSAVKAITGATGADFARLEDKAKQMGATTVFSATQSGEAMEALARAGFSTSETIDALGGVMAAAAADSMPLATAAQITSQVIRAMGLEAGEANRVADVLALTSARTNTDIIGLGEAFKFAAAQSKIMGIDLETTASAIGVISDAGIRGTLAGTSFTNMLVKLSRPSSKATKLMKKYGMAVFETAEGNLDLRKTLASVGAGLKDVTSKTKRAAAITEIFGIRGQKAVSAIDQAITSGKFATLSAELDKANGKAKEMAEVRLANLHGAITLAKSAMEGFWIETAGLFLGPIQGKIKGFTKLLGGVVTALQLISTGVDENDERWRKLSPTVRSVAKGIRQGIDDIKAGVKWLGSQWDALMTQFGVTSPETIQWISRIATVLAIAAAVLGPVILVAGMALTAIGGVIAAIGAGIAAIAAAGWPLILAAIGAAVSAIAMVATAIGVVLGVLAVLKADGIKVSEALRLGIQLVSAAWNWLVQNAIKPFTDAIKKEVLPVFVKFKASAQTTLMYISMKWSEVFSGAIQIVRRLTPVFRLVFRTLGKIVGAFAAVTGIAMRAIVQFTRPVIGAFVAIGKVIVESVISVLIKMVAILVKAGDAIKAVTGKDLIPKELREIGTTNFEFLPTGAPDTSVAGLIGKGTGTRDVAGMIDWTLEDMANTIGEGVAQGATEGVSDGLAKQKGAASAPGSTKVDLSVGGGAPIKVDTKVDIDGHEVARATGHARLEISERAGFQATPWQRRLIIEQGFAPSGGMTGGF